MPPYSQVNDKTKLYQPFDFNTLVSLLQVPLLDIEAEIANRSPKSLNSFDWQVVKQRIASAQKWLQDYVDEVDRLRDVIEANLSNLSTSLS